MQSSEVLVTTHGVGRHSRQSLSELLDFRLAGSLLVLAVLAILVVAPLIFMVLASFRPAGVLPMAPGTFTLSHYTQSV